MTPELLLIDLDETVYPSSSNLWGAIRERIDLYLNQKMRFGWDEIPAFRQQMYTTYGTTLCGLRTLYQIDPYDYLAFVHDIPLADYLKPDPALRPALQSIPTRKIIFTNADVKHARRVLDVMGVADCFEDIIDVMDISPYCKPHQEAFDIVLKRVGLSASQCALVDDTLHNLAAAREMGFFAVRVGTTELLPQYHAAIERLADLPQVAGIA